jgi:hypothetical protein
MFLRQGPYHVERTDWARLVLGWVTAWESRVPLALPFCQFLENSNILIIRFAIAIPILLHNIDLNFRSNNKHFLKSDKHLEELLIVGFYKLETESKIYESACNF